MRVIRMMVAVLGVVGQMADIPNGVTKSAGTDAGSGIQYALVSLDGRLVGGAGEGTPAPRLTAQCMKMPSGTLKFELLAHFGGVPEVKFDAPWKPSPGEDFAPRLEKAQVTMEFLGYTKVKPVRRQWDYLSGSIGELRYAPPGMSSSNMEEIAYYMQYVRSLPTLRLSSGTNAAEWETAKWQVALHQEPLCGAGGF